MRHIMNMRHACKTLVVSACCAVPLGCVCAEESAPAPVPAREAKPLPLQQKKIGAEIDKAGRLLQDLLDEAAQNFGRELQDFAEDKTSRAVLEELSGRSIPRIVDRLREGDAGALQESARDQQQVVEELDRLIKVLKTELTPWAARKGLEHALELQHAAASAVKSGDDATAADLRRAGELQRKVTAAIDDARRKLDAYASQIRPHDPEGAAKVDRVRSGLEAARLADTSTAAADDIDRNKPELAHAKQEKVIGILVDAAKGLPGHDDSVASAERKVKGLEAARGKLDEAIGATNDLRPEDDEGAAAVAGKQGEVSAAISAALDGDPGRKDDLADKSNDAKRDIASGKPGSANGKQKDLAGDLDRELTRAKDELAAAKAGKGQSKPGQAQAGKPQPGQPGPNGQPEGAPAPGEGLAQTANAKPTPESKQHEAGLGTIQYGKLRADLQPGVWHVALQAKNRSDVLQAVAQKFPQRYRRQLAIYYQNLARE